MINTVDDLLKQLRLSVFTGERRVSEDILVRCFFDEIEGREKRKVKKRSTNHYGDFLWYVSYDGRLARVPNTNKNPLGKRLLKEHIIYTDENGIRRGTREIREGQYPRIRPLLDELDRANRWANSIKLKICEYLDGGLQCSMIIDRDFKTAYEPRYSEDFCLEGDLVTGQSCMSGNGQMAEEFYGGIDGCYVCRFEDSDGDQVGRCIMYKYKDQRHFIRVYAKRDYAKCALRLIREEMTDNDIIGRSECIEDMCLHTNWSDDVQVMYLDGNEYGFDPMDWTVGTDYRVDMKTTGEDELSEYLWENGYARCQNCGEYCDRDDMIGVGGDYFCCEDCIADYGCKRCDHCGEWISPSCGYETPDGEIVCSKSCLNAKGYTICRGCGKIIPLDEVEYACGYSYCSEDCANNDGYFKCSVCGKYEMSCDLKPSLEHDKKLVCWNCAKGANLELVWTKTITEAKND